MVEKEKKIENNEKETKITSMRFCVEYRILKAITLKDAYPLPCISLAEHKYFYTIEMTCGHCLTKKTNNSLHSQGAFTV